MCQWVEIFLEIDVVLVVVYTLFQLKETFFYFKSSLVHV